MIMIAPMVVMNHRSDSMIMIAPMIVMKRHSDCWLALSLHWGMSHNKALDKMISDPTYDCDEPP